MTPPALTRRGLLAGAAATGAAAAVPATARGAAGRRTRKADVAVVGAGLAGLVAARELARRGRDVVVLEADHRVGGRTENHKLGKGDVTELMGEFADPTHDRVLALAKSLGVRTFKTYNQGQNVFFARGKRTPYPANSLLFPDDVVNADVVRAIPAINAMAAAVDLVEPWKSAHAFDLDSQTFAAAVGPQFQSASGRSFLETATQAIWGADAREMSLLYALWYIRAATNVATRPGTLERLITTGGGAQEIRFVGGSQILSIKLARRLGDRVVLSSPVNRITQSHRGVVVESERVTVKAERAIVTVPPAMGTFIDFRPELPALRAQLIQRMPAGSLVKAEVLYARPFWRDLGLTGQAISDTGPCRSTFDNTPPDGKPGVLFAFIGGTDARRFMSMSPRSRRAAVLDQFAVYFGDQARSAKGYVEDYAASEEWLRGGPVGLMAPGTLSEYGPALRRPFRRVHFAGSETSVLWPGYMDGAVRSGERVAKEVVAAG